MRHFFLISFIACLFSGISRCHDAGPLPKPVLNSHSSQSATHDSPHPDLPNDSTQPPPSEHHPQPHHHQGAQQQSRVPDTVRQGNELDSSQASGHTAHGESEKGADNAEASVGKQTVKTTADSTPYEDDKGDPSQAGELGGEKEVQHSVPQSSHHHHQQNQQQQQIQPPQHKDSVDHPFSAPPSEAGKEVAQSKHSGATNGQLPSTAVPDTRTVHAQVAEDTEAIAQPSAASPGTHPPDAATVSSSISEPPFQTTADQDSSNAADPPPPQVESPYPDSQASNKEADPLTIHPPNQPPPSLALGSGGMVVDDTDLLTPEKVGEEDRVEVKELTEDFQTFGEWRKKVLEEELEKENEKVKQELSQRDPHAMGTVSTQKLRVNYASEKCGAKVVACNPEMENGNHMLTANKDEYMINPCAAKKWFVIELCEPISVKMVEMASMELFSSQPHAFSLSLSDRYPAKDWVTGGKYELSAERAPQLFHLSVTSPYVKFVRVDMLDHHGNEHFCPVTLFRVFGLPMEEDDDDSVQPPTESEEEQGEGKSETLFAKTKATVVSLVKKVLYKDQEEKQQQQKQGDGEMEKHANFSGEEAMPCDPDEENKRLLEKNVGGTPITVHQPQPTIHAVQENGGLSSGSVTEVPMVTKLQEGEQLEIEEKSKQHTGQEQHLVTLLESGRTLGWERAVHLCHPRPRVKVNLSCVFSSSCLYVQALLGSPPPISLPRPLSFMAHYSPLSPSLTGEQLMSMQDLEPSFSSRFVTQLESHQQDIGLTVSDPVHIQPSSDISTDLQSSSSTQATSAIPTHPSISTVTSVISTPSSVPQQDKSESQVVTKKIEVEGSVQDSGATVASETTKTLVTAVSSGNMVETDIAAVPSSSSSEPAAKSSSEVASDALTGERAEGSVTQSQEVLQPSEEMDTTGVQSPGLMRPTPVLEMTAASVSMQDEDRDSGLSSLSPSPTSQITHPPLDSAGFPQIVEPTVQESQSEVELQDPQSTEAVTSDSQPMSTPAQKEDVVLQNDTMPSATSNNTDKKGGDLDLVTVPLSLSAKRESAVMRLTNRIKALELNVSLSSRFLEELSARFKKQNEEMMKMLNKTMIKFNSTAVASQRQVVLQEQRLDHLETRLDNLTDVVQRLAHNFDSFTQQVSDRQMMFTTLNLLVLVVSVVLCCRALHSKPLHPDVQFLLDTMPRHPPPPTPYLRRNSDLALHHSSHLPMAEARRKGGSLANLGSVDGASLLLLDTGETGPKKKKRKKNKGLRIGSVDTENQGGTMSDLALRMQDLTVHTDSGTTNPGDAASTADASHAGSRPSSSETTRSSFRTASLDGSQGMQWGTELGHRRSGSATASFFCLADPPRSAVVSACQPAHRMEGVKEVQFSLGGQVLSEPNDLPPLTPAPCLLSQSVTTKPPLPCGSQRSNSLTGCQPCALINSWDSAHVSSTQDREYLQQEESISLPFIPTHISSLVDSRPPSQNTTLIHKVPVFHKPKKSLPVMNGDRDVKAVTSDSIHTTQRKGSFRGLGEEGKGVGNKGKGGKKTGHAQWLEKA